LLIQINYIGSPNNMTEVISAIP